MDTAALVERLSALDTCAVSDALDSMGKSGAVIGLVRRSTNATIAGRVQTMKLSAGKPPGDSNSHLGTYSIEAARETDVIVVEQRSGIDAAGWGGLLATAAKTKGVRGIIIEGPGSGCDEDTLG